MSDPTAIPIQFDPREQRMRGVAYHGNTPFDVPFISHIEGNLYQGGCQNGLMLPREIKNVFSLYQWEQYRVGHELDTFVQVRMYDSESEPVDRGQVLALAHHVAYAMSKGPTLVHCQAGLNRSSLVAATALWIKGHDAATAVDLLRTRRSPAVLCNKVFENWVLGLDA